MKLILLYDDKAIASPYARSHTFRPTKERSMMKALTLTFALLLICTGAALAQTPDGETPAEETVCDSETGAAYGLCNAYCEAMDCETDNPNASATACSRVQDKFQQITGRDLPCEVPQVRCPCNDPAVNATFAALVAGQITITACDHSGFSPGTRVTYNSSAQAFGGVERGQPLCGTSSPSHRLFPTLEEALVCSDLLAQAAANQGVPCP
jgi:hypothetical protein